ncbi:MAG TPA: hypothetical protein V6C85_03825 [Allocoleopsis sp.]
MTKEPQPNEDTSNPVPSAASTPAQAEPIAIPKNLVRQEHLVRDLILDYALGASILGLIPIRGLFTVKLLVTAGLILKMIWDIGKLWGFRKGQDCLAIAGSFFGGLGALAMAFTAWLTMFGVGLFVPYIKSLALAAALFTLTWSLGQATKQFYASGYSKE